MLLLCRTAVLLTVIAACGLVAGCRDNPLGPSGVVPSLPDVDPATVLFLDDFDNENNGVGIYNWTNFAQWNVLAGCVDLHGNGFHDVQPGNGLYVDLDGSCEGAGTIETKAEFTLAPGNYVLEFWIAGNHRIRQSDTVRVTLGTVFQEEMTLAANERFHLRVRNITVTSPTTARLRFQNFGDDWQGALLDLVRLRRAT